MKIQKVFIALLFFCNSLFTIFQSSHISKLLAVASGVGCYALHDFVVSKCNKKPVAVFDSFEQKEKKEKTPYEEIYQEFFRDGPLISILTSLYQEGPLSYYISKKGSKDSQQNFISENSGIFSDTLIASFYTHDFIKQIKEKKFILSKDNNQNIINFSLGVTRGLLYFLLEEQIQYFLSSISYFKNKKMITSLLSSMLKVGMISGVLDKLFYRFVQTYASNSNFVLEVGRQDAEMKEKIDSKEYVALVELGTLQTNALIYMIKVVDKLRR